MAEDERSLAKDVSDTAYNLGGAMFGRPWRQEELSKNGVDKAAFAGIEALYQEFRGRVGALMQAKLQSDVYVDLSPPVRTPSLDSGVGQLQSQKRDPDPDNSTWRPNIGPGFNKKEYEESRMEHILDTDRTY